MVRLKFNFLLMFKKSHYHIHIQTNKYTTAELGKYKEKLIIPSIIITYLTIEKKN